MNSLTSTREQFAVTATSLLDERADLALVYAEISGQLFGEATRRHPGRVVNVGIREQLLVGASAGLALAGLRPIVHTFAPFLVERPFEQIKLSFAHQDVGGVLVSAGASFDIAAGGRTHQAPGDVALMLTVPGAHIHMPSTTQEVDAVVRAAAEDTGLHYVRVSEQTNAGSFGPGLHVVRRSHGGPTVIALGPVLDEVLAATAHHEATVIYANTLDAMDAATLRPLVMSTDVIVVEPWLEGTTAHLLSSALADRPRRLLSIGVGRAELRRYGTPTEHRRAHGLDATGIRSRIRDFITGTRFVAAGV